MDNPVAIVPPTHSGNMFFVNLLDTFILSSHYSMKFPNERITDN